jgi:hypothetical protein
VLLQALIAGPSAAVNIVKVFLIMLVFANTKTQTAYEDGRVLIRFRDF